MTRKSFRRLGIERLEDRTLLAVATFAYQIWDDQDGSPGEPLDHVTVGQSFFLEITAEETHPLYAGLSGVALDLKWDPAVMEVVDAESFAAASVVTGTLPFRLGTLDASAGLVDDLVGSVYFNSGAPLGANGPERFALMKMQAIAASTSTTLTMNEGLSGITTFPAGGRSFLFEPLSFPIIAEIAAPINDPIDAPQVDDATDSNDFDVDLGEWDSTVEFSDSLPITPPPGDNLHWTQDLILEETTDPTGDEVSEETADEIVGDTDNETVNEPTSDTLGETTDELTNEEFDDGHAMACAPFVETLLGGQAADQGSSSELPVELLTRVFGPEVPANWIPPAARPESLDVATLRSRRGPHAPQSIGESETPPVISNQLLDLLAASRLARGRHAV